jgi:hypothetical protein
VTLTLHDPREFRFVRTPDLQGDADNARIAVEVRITWRLRPYRASENRHESVDRGCDANA